MLTTVRLDRRTQALVNRMVRRTGRSIEATPVWPALTDAMDLVGSSRRAQRQLLGWVIDGAIRILPVDGDDVARIRDLREKYRDLPMDLADAALVRVAERERITTVFTLDRRDFSLYRPARLGHFRVVP